METLKISKTWLFTLEKGNGYLIGKLNHTGVEYACIKIVMPTAPNMFYEIESFKCNQEINNNDKMLLINHIIINILFSNDVKPTKPFLSIKDTTDKNINFIKNYIPKFFLAE